MPNIAVMTEPTTPACLRCRNQKLKCSRDKPKCSRCRRLNTDCVYVPRQTCKNPSHCTATPRKRRKSDVSSDATDLTHVKSFNDAEIAIDGTKDSAGEFATIDQQEALMDLYFTCSFNSSLVFHKPAFMQQFEEKLVSRAVCLALCAMGSIFIHSSSCTPQQKALLANIPNIEESARQWAVQAGAEVLQQMEEPTIEGIQTCQVLGIYWFSRDEPQRNNLFTGIAYRALRTLVLARNDNPISSDSTTNEAISRMFWAAWTQDCINADHYIVGSSLDPQLMRIELPASSKAFHSGVSEPQGRLGNDTSNLGSTPGSSDISNVSVMAEAMKLVLIWAQVRDHLEMRTRLPVQSWVDHLATFEARLENWSTDLPICLRYSKRALFGQLVNDQEQMYIVIFATYHQCRLNLHSSLVPRLSGTKLQDGLPLEAVHSSAKAAIDSARHLSALARDVLALEWDLARMPPFVGYCMYTSSVIHMTLLDSQLDGIGPSARADLFSSLRLLKAMKATWKHLDRLWARALVLFQVRMQAISQQGSKITYPTDSSLSTTNELHEVEKRREDANNLPEPLTQSLLHHSLSKVRSDISVKETQTMADNLNGNITYDQIRAITEDMLPTASFSPEDSWLEMQQKDASAYVNDLKLDEFTMSALQGDFVLDNNLWGQDMTAHSTGLSYLNDPYSLA